MVFGDSLSYFDEAMGYDYDSGPPAQYCDAEPPTSFGLARAVTPLSMTYPMKIGWLKSKQKWPDCAERKVERYMAENEFYHYYKTKDESKRHLEAMVTELRQLFDPNEFDEAIHVALLKDKVLNKMHRIRDKKNPLAGLKKVLQRLHRDHYEAALEYVLDTLRGHAHHGED